MGCIEINLIVLKNKVLCQINRNMGCIEIVHGDAIWERRNEINRNMGCIEILLNNLISLTAYGLIETWDVLKFQDPLQLYTW